MGLIETAVRAATGTLHDTWKDYFYCESLENDIIVQKAQHKTKGMFNKDSENIITDGSVIAVADGQCAVIVEQGKVVDLCAKTGEFTYHRDSEPSLFTGDLGAGVTSVFKEIGKRFTFGGIPAGDQRVYFFNTKELTGIKYGTPNAVPFRIVDQRAGVDLDIGLRCFGEYSIRVEDPILFYTNVSGNVSDAYRLPQLEEQMRSELLTALQPAFAKLSAQGIRTSELPGHTTELADALNEELSKKWTQLRGIRIVSFGISSLSVRPEDEQIIRDLQRNAAYTNPALANAALIGAQAQAMQDAAKNPNGAMSGFVGMNMAASVPTAMQQTAPQAAAQNAPQWYCSKCGNPNDGNFCSKCGAPKPKD